MPSRGSDDDDALAPIRASMDDSARATRAACASSGESIAAAARLLVEAALFPETLAT